ncbi:hypothetical protein [Nonomuraea sp. NPDC048916]|uniref:hypothetical protein n=1 Tax=Nonomuraea sp. NPDC048916 TaxID=3154232 RepID=UPI0033F22F6A
MSGPRQAQRTGQKPPARKRRRTPRSDWQLPLLTDWGVPPERQKLLVVITSVVGVIAVAFGFVAFAASLGEYVPERRASAAMFGTDVVIPEVYHGWPSPKLFDPITDRAKDGKPLTQKEVFGQKTLTGEKRLTLKLVARKLDTDCAAALWGQELLDAVADAECSQAARGVYTSADGRYVGQYTLLNLRDGQAANALVETLKTGYRGGWTRLLESGQVSFPSGGHTEGGGYALGHYVGLVWIGRADGAEPTAKDDYVSLALTLRGAEKAVYRRVVTITGPRA